MQFYVWTDVESMVTRNNTPRLLSLGMLIKEDSQDENPISMQTMLQVIWLCCRMITEVL